MESHGIRPERITKPIQLLAAWLIGLFATNASFLLAAQQIDKPTWGSAMLLIACVVNVPLFIGALFLLQTKFRAQMQEDQYYSKYLDEERKTGYSKALSEKSIEEETRRTVEKIIASIGGSAEGKEEPIAEILQASQTELFAYKHGSSRAMTELYKSPQTWALVATKFSENETFKREVDGLLSDGLVVQRESDLSSIEFTESGKKVAQFAESNNLLYSQRHAKRWADQRSYLNKSARESSGSQG